MNVTKAIIMVAGWGTRMLPITKSIEKCMLPIGTRPVIDFVVRDIVSAGIKDIYFVVGEQSHSFRVTIVPIYPLMTIYAVSSGVICCHLSRL